MTGKLIATKLKHKLLATNVKRKDLVPGRHYAGTTLYLNVRKNGTRAWEYVYRDRVTGKLRYMGLGGPDALSLAEAREAVRVLRKGLQAGTDPIEAKREAAQAAKLERAKARTFEQCRDAYIAAHVASWRNAKHGQQWTNSLGTHAAKLLPLPVQAIDTDLVLGVLEPIWTERRERRPACGSGSRPSWIGQQPEATGRGRTPPAGAATLRTYCRWRARLGR